MRTCFHILFSKALEDSGLDEHIQAEPDYEGDDGVTMETFKLPPIHSIKQEMEMVDLNLTYCE